MYILLILLLFINCINSPELQPEISWSDVAGTRWGLVEELNIYQNVHQSFRFGEDTVYATKTYWNPKDLTKSSWIRYFKGPALYKHYENDPVYHTPNLVYTWSRKEYADSLYQQPVMGNSIVDDWFLWKIDSLGQLLMGYVDLDRACYYWEFTREYSTTHPK